MKLKMTLILDDQSRRAIPVWLPFEEAPYGLAAGPCPACAVTVEHQASAERPAFAVKGGGRRPSTDDLAWEADGHCVTCRAYVGTIRVETGTLFGVREDRAVLEGRCRVY